MLAQWSNSTYACLPLCWGKLDLTQTVGKRMTLSETVSSGDWRVALKTALSKVGDKGCWCEVELRTVETGGDCYCRRGLLVGLLVCGERLEPYLFCRTCKGTQTKWWCESFEHLEHLILVKRHVILAGWSKHFLQTLASAALLKAFKVSADASLQNLEVCGPEQKKHGVWFFACVVWTVAFCGGFGRETCLCVAKDIPLEYRGLGTPFLSLMGWYELGLGR